MARVISAFPKQALWPMVGVMRSKREDRKLACREVTARAEVRATHLLTANPNDIQAQQPNIRDMIAEADRVSTTLLRLADDKSDIQERYLSVRKHFGYVLRVFPSKMIVPLQDALTCVLPSAPDLDKSYNPFPGDEVVLDGGLQNHSDQS
jgi:serine/threonine-protein kinase ATR